MTAYDCTKCLAFCCSIYERVQVTKRDLDRLAKHFGVSVEAARRRYTAAYEDERVLKRSRDPLLGESCHFLDRKTRGCTIYRARPAACRAYPGQSRCAYYDVLRFERSAQDDDSVVPLVKIRFRKS